MPRRRTTAGLVTATLTPGAPWPSARALRPSGPDLPRLRPTTPQERHGFRPPPSDARRRPGHRTHGRLGRSGHDGSHCPCPRRRGVRPEREAGRQGGRHGPAHRQQDDSDGDGRAGPPHRGRRRGPGLRDGAAHHAPGPRRAPHRRHRRELGDSGPAAPGRHDRAPGHAQRKPGGLRRPPDRQRGAVRVHAPVLLRRRHQQDLCRRGQRCVPGRPARRQRRRGADPRGAGAGVVGVGIHPPRQPRQLHALGERRRPVHGVCRRARPGGRPRPLPPAHGRPGSRGAPPLDGCRRPRACLLPRRPQAGLHEPRRLHQPGADRRRPRDRGGTLGPELSRTGRVLTDPRRPAPHDRPHLRRGTLGVHPPRHRCPQHPLRLRRRLGARRVGPGRRRLCRALHRWPGPDPAPCLGQHVGANDARHGAQRGRPLVVPPQRFGRLQLPPAARCSSSTAGSTRAAGTSRSCAR